MRSERSLRTTADFRRAREGGRRVSRAGVTVYARRRATPGPGRLGLAVGKRCGGAVARNRIKRRLREAYRRSGAPDAVDVVARADPEAGGTSFQELVATFRTACDGAS